MQFVLKEASCHRNLLSTLQLTVQRDPFIIEALKILLKTFSVTFCYSVVRGHLTGPEGPTLPVRDKSCLTRNRRTRKWLDLWKKIALFFWALGEVTIHFYANRTDNIISKKNTLRQSGFMYLKCFRWVFFSKFLSSVHVLSTSKRKM